MLFGENEKRYPSAKTLVRAKAASRIHAKDATLYDFSPEAQACAENFMGWTTLASNPPCKIRDIRAFANEVRSEGFDTVLLIGQGGSTQAAMTLTKYNKVDRNAMDFRVLDSVSPTRVRSILNTIKPEKTLVLASSKSGGTLEMKSVLSAVIEHFETFMKATDVPKHLVAITDPGTDLEKRALEKGWRKVFSGEPTVGGRFSALSVFGLVPAALVGIDLSALLGHARVAEALCAEDSVDNPAVMLASFLYDNYLQGRDKFCFLTPKRGRVLGLWIEQLVAESTGKQGLGILPNIEIDALNLVRPRDDRSVIMYRTKTDLWDERNNFEMSLSYVNPSIPHIDLRVDNVSELAEHFIMWEYATAMLGYLLKVCPFDQPDVASTKAAAQRFLAEGLPEPNLVHPFLDEDLCMGDIEVTAPDGIIGEDTIGTLANLFATYKPGDYVAIDAFLPYDGEGRREAMENIRHGIAKRLGCVSCLEIGPRYLHSTGQLQKGGPRTGIFIVISADEMKDIEVKGVPGVSSLGQLAKTQAAADLSIMMERGLRCVHLHLPDNAGITIRALHIAMRRAIVRAQGTDKY